MTDSYDQEKRDWFKTIQRQVKNNLVEISVQREIEKKLEDASQAMARVGVDLDDRINFRVNSGLKSEFEKLCKVNHTTLSRELKRYMTRSVESQENFS